MASDDDRLLPPWHQAGDIGAHDGFAEHGSVEDVTDGAVWRTIHFLEVELLHARLVGGDGGALDAHVVLLWGTCTRCRTHPTFKYHDGVHVLEQ